MLKPINDFVVVKPQKKEEKTASGILLPETEEKHEKDQGEIVAVGPGKYLENGCQRELQVKVGDRVIFKKWGAEDFEEDGELFKIMDQENILAIVVE